MIKELNNSLIENSYKLQQIIVIMNENSILMGDINCVVLCETAVGLLSKLAAEVISNSIIHNHDDEIRNIIGIFTALDLLQYPQPRKINDCNSIRSYMDVILDIQGTTPFDELELKLLHNLPRMQNGEGKSGSELKLYYLDLAKNNPSLLLFKINELKNKYKKIMDKLRSETTQYSIHPLTDVDKVIGIP